MLHIPNLVNIVDGTSDVYDSTDRTQADDMANVRALHAAANVTQNLQG